VPHTVYFPRLLVRYPAQLGRVQPGILRAMMRAHASARSQIFLCLPARRSCLPGTRSTARHYLCLDHQGVLDKMEAVLDLSHGLVQYGGKPCVMYLFGPDKQEWFDCRCIAEILGINNVTMAMERVDPASKSHLDDLIGRLGQPEVLSRLPQFNLGNLSHHDMRSWVVDEAGFYDLTFGSRKAEAVAFRRWVCREVLPQLRKTGSFSLKRKTEAVDDPFAKKMAVGQFAVQEMQATGGILEMLLKYGDGGDKVWGLDGLKNAVIKKDRRIDDFDRPAPTGAGAPLAIEGPREIYISDVAIAMGYNRKLVQPALGRIGMQVRRQWNENNPDRAAQGPPKRGVVYNNKTRKENVYYESDRAMVEEGIRLALGELNDE
jgi:prophage antirepressor-like protein